VNDHDTRFALKVDVDTHRGLATGVPALADLFAVHGVRASFFVVCGPDRTGRRLARLLDPRFVAKLVRTRAVSVYGWRTMLSGTVLPARAIAGSFPDALRALAAAGHEVGVHGWDHAHWQDRLPRLSSAAVRAEVVRARETLRGILGVAPPGFAAPGWRCTPASLAAVDAAGFFYRSDTRGRSPFRPVANGRVFRAPEIPTTLPTLDELWERRSQPAALVDRWLALLRPGALNVHTVHAELEGGPHLETLDALLARVVERARLVRLCDEAAALAAVAVPVCPVAEGRVPGRAMPVALQGADRVPAVA
jgi:peptidoglycan/xylan/chitin deacetylase (PgdA/CDA1 family)